MTAKADPESAFRAAVEDRGMLGASGVLALQKVVGNRAVAGMIQAKLGRPRTDVSARVAPATVKASKVQKRLQLDGGAPAPATTDDAVHAAARAATSGSASTMPHLDAIQRSFGAHDISSIQAHTNDKASASTRAMGAEAFASGDHVAFADAAPSLHTAAHEAAHVIQQRGGVQLEGGVGAVGDAYEQHADAVADRVVQGRSAEHLLAGSTGATASAAASVQHKMTFAKLGSDYAYIMGTLVRHAFSKHSKVIRKLDSAGTAILAAVAAPYDMPNAIEQMMQAPEDFGEYDLDKIEDLARLFTLFKKKLPWQQYEGKTVDEALRAGAKGERHEGEKREALTDTEEGQGGYAQLPMLTQWAESDKANSKRLKHFAGGEREAVTFKLERGKLVSAVDNHTVLATTNTPMKGYPDMFRAMTDVAEAEGVKDINSLDNTKFEQLQEKARELGPTLIYVMNARGFIFAAKEIIDVLHHSSFLAGGAIAGAGTIRTTSDGTINFISNKSGHYKPAPAYLWQVLHNMASNGVNLAGIKIWVLGMKREFPSAKHFFEAFDPSKDPRFFDNDWAVKKLDEIVGAH